MECRVRSVECEVWSLKRRVYSVECKVIHIFQPLAGADYF